MKVKNKTAIVFDIEIFPNFFCCGTKNTETKEINILEISERDCCLTELYDLFSNRDYIFVGYNCIHYDTPIINFLFRYKATLLQTSNEEILTNLYNLSKLIIDDNKRDLWKEYKYAKYFDTLDLLTMLYSSKLRVGLKELQVTMQYPDVEEYQGDFDATLPYGMIDEVIQYNINDINSTEELLNRCEKDIRLREGIEQEFDVDVLSKDGMTIGTEILKHKYLEKTGKSWFDIKDLRSPCNVIDLNNIIFSNVYFRTKQLQDLLSRMKSLKISTDRKGFEEVFYLQDMKTVVSVGGIHGDNGIQSILPKDNELCLDSDVNSLYPSLIVSYNLVPKHLGNEFLEIYSAIKDERLYAKKHHQEIKNQTYKLALNGLLI